MCRKFLYSFITFLLVVAILEIFSFLFIKLYAKDHYEDIFWYDYEKYIANIPDSYIEKFRKYSYDKDLGWDVTPNVSRTDTNTAGSSWTQTIDPKGSRHNSFTGDKTFISTYGDSYTFGHEVNDDETWEYYLSQQTNTNVLNFGVGAFGVEQSFLKLKRNFGKGIKTPIVILSIWSGEIHRLHNMYRPFFRKVTGMKLAFKPIVIKTDEGFKLIENPLQKINSRQDILGALHKAMEHDLWFKSRKIKNEFPYSFRITELVLVILRDQHKLRYNQWKDPETIGKLDYLINLFYNHSQENDYLPVVVFIPDHTELKNRRKSFPTSYAEFLKDTIKKYDKKRIFFVDVYEKEFDERYFNIKEFGGHTSTYGNQIIAQEIYEAINKSLAELQRGKDEPVDY